MISALKAAASVVEGVANGTCAGVNVTLLGVGLLPLHFGSIALLKEGVAVHSCGVELDKHAWGSEAMVFPAATLPKFKLAHWFWQLQRAGALSGELSPR